MRITYLAGLLLALASFAPLAFAGEVTYNARLGGDDVAVDVYAPDGPAIGVAIVAHGFTRDRSRHRNLGRSLAEAGVLAVVPDLPSVADHWSNGDALADFVRDIEHGALGMPPTPRAQIVLLGTSAGGLASVLAAAQLPGLGGWIGLDPVDRTGSGVRAATKVASPSIVMLGEPSGCNLLGSGSAIAEALPALVRADTLVGASHCDFESPTTRFCRVTCGRGAPGMDDVVREATVRAVRELLDLSARAPKPQAMLEVLREEN
jgi:dienelactone hydrolase